MHCSPTAALHPWRQALPKIGLVVLLLGMSLFLTSGIGLAATGTGSIAGTITYIGGVPGEHPILVCASPTNPDPPCKWANADGTYEIPLLPDDDFTVRALVNVYSDSYDDWSGAVEGWYDADNDGQADDVPVRGGAVTGIDISVGGPWISLDGPKMEGGEVVALAVNASAPEMVYAAVKGSGSTGNGRVYKSGDGGATWTAVYTPSMSVVDLAARGDKFCIAGFDGGSYHLFCSDDAGATWGELSAIDSENVVHVADLVISSEVSPTLLVAGRVMDASENYETSAVFGTADGGATWERLLERPNPAGQRGAFFAITEDPSTPGRFFVGGSEAATGDPGQGISSIYRVTGGEWVSATQVYSSATRSPIIALAVDPTNSGVILAATPTWLADAYLLRSADGGDTWEEALAGVGADVAFAASGAAYAITGDGFIYASTDGGAHWGSGVSVPNYCFRLAAGNELYAAGCSDGVLRSTDDGATWAPSNSGITSLVSPSRLAVDPFDPEHLYAAADCGGGWSSSDGGATWAKDPVGCIGTYAFDPRREGIVYRGDYAREFGAVERSGDGGLTWGVVYTATIGLHPGSQSEEIIFAIAPAPSRPATIYAGGADQPAGEGRHATIVRSTRDGAVGSWTEVLSMTAESWVNALAVHPFDARVVYAGGAWMCGNEGCEGFVRRSSDGGATWSTVFTDTQEIKTLAIDAADPGTLYVGSASYRIFRSADDGESWTAVRLPPWEQGGASGDQVVADPRAGGRVYLGGWGTVLESFDGGDTWLDQPGAFAPAPQQSPVSLTVVDHGNRQTLYFGGEGLWSFTRLAPPGVYRNAIPSVIRPAP